MAAASATATDLSGVFVWVAAERLRALEALEAEVNRRKTPEEHDSERIKQLHDRDKANPQAVAKRASKYYESHKDEINARRREKRRMAREAAIEAKSPGAGSHGP